MAVITWVLVGVFTGNLVNSFPITTHLACIEVCILQVEFEADGKDDSKELDFALHVSDHQCVDAEIWHPVQACGFTQSGRTVRKANLVRGPPSC